MKNFEGRPRNVERFLSRIFYCITVKCSWEKFKWEEMDL
jgi:hypothetical protein